MAAAVVLAVLFPVPASAVVAHDPAPPTSCLARSTTAEGVSRLVKDFMRAYNVGDVAGLETVFSHEPEFEWYTVSRGRRQEVAAFNRVDLPPYFARRHLAGDHLKLLKLDVRDERGWHGGFDFSFRLVRSSDQRGAEGYYHGKGAAGCTIFVWSMGRGR